MNETADEWLLRYYGLAKVASAELRERFDLMSEERPYPPNGRYGAVRWSSHVAFISFFADVWEKHRSVSVGVMRAGETAITNLGVDVGVAYTALGVKRPSRREYKRDDLPAELARDVRLAGLLEPILRGDLDYEQQMRDAQRRHRQQQRWWQRL